MRRVTIWITATLAVLAVVLAYQLNASGSTGKGGDEGNHSGTAVEAPANPSAAGSPAPGGTDPRTGTAASPTAEPTDDSGDADRPGYTAGHTDKPGESK